MPRTLRCICFFFFAMTALYAGTALHARDIYVTGLEAELDVKPEFNRAFYYCLDVSLAGALELNNYLTFGGGLSMGEIGFATGNSVSAYNAFGKTEYRFPIRFPLELGFFYIYNGIPDYKTNMHTMLPLLSSKGKWAGLSLGTTLRYTVFDHEPPFFESTLALLVFVNFVNTERVRVGLKAANFSDFLAGNMGAYFLNLNTSIKFGRRLYFINEIELYQTGSIGLTATFYGIAYRGGIKYQW